jgi:hypothetical protein
MYTLGTGTSNTDPYPSTVFRYFSLCQVWHRTRNEVDLPAGIENFNRSWSKHLFPLVLEPTTRTLKCAVSDNLTINYVYMLVFSVIFKDKNQQPN